MKQQQQQQQMNIALLFVILHSNLFTLIYYVFISARNLQTNKNGMISHNTGPNWIVYVTVNCEEECVACKQIRNCLKWKWARPKHLSPEYVNGIYFLSTTTKKNAAAQNVVLIAFNSLWPFSQTTAIWRAFKIVSAETLLTSAQ